MAEDYRKYMEGNYDGNFIQQYMQMEDDKKWAEQIAEDVKAAQGAALESEKKRLSDEYEMTGEELNALMKSYNQENKFKEYLIDGAILRCNQAITDDFPFSEEETVVLVNKNEECCNITLNVSENPISVDKLRYATVKDTLINVNIIPPKCNCKLAVNRNSERRKIREDSKRNENGACMHLMRLNEEWDNLEVDGTRYLKKMNIEPSMFSAGVGRIIGGLDNAVEEEVDGITMTSVLFCKHGGLITPVTSGQENIKMTLDLGIDKMTQYLLGEISEKELDSVVQWIADNCGLSVNDMIKEDFSIEPALSRSRSFDDQIIAWTYYWNVKIQNDDSFKSKFKIDPNIVKAMMAQESSFGELTEEYKARNPSRNVMQSLATGNPTVWIASGINPYADGMFSPGDSISFIMLDGTVGTDGKLYRGNLPLYEEIHKKNNEEDPLEDEREKQHFNDFEVLKNIFEIGDNGKYMVNFNKVTPNMSIATGVGLLAFLIQDKGSVYDGIKEYNTGADYIGSINTHLENMGCKKIEK